MISLLLPDGLHIRSYVAGDAGLLFRTVDENRAHLRPWLPWVDRTTRQEHSQEFIQDARQQQERGAGMALGILREGELLGGIGLHQWQQDLRRAQMGYWLAQKEVGKGTITRCAARLISFAFERLHLNKMELHFVAGNERSAAVSARLGARVEGVIRAAILQDGAPRDLVITGILRDEWKEPGGG